MREEQKANIKVFYDEKLLAESPFEVFDAGYWEKKDAVLGSATGRGTTWFIQAKELPCALRHYYRGGLFGKLVRDAFPFSGWKNSRSFREFELLAYLRSHDFPVPRPVAARIVRHGFFYQADLLSELISDTQDLVSLLSDVSISDALCREIGQVVRRLHDLGICHTDLNIHNILIDKAQKVWLIDFDKCSRRDGDTWKKENLSRLERSFNKEIHRRQIHWTSEMWARLLDGYNG